MNSAVTPFTAHRSRAKLVRFRGVYLDVEVCPPDEQKPKPSLGTATRSQGP